MGPADHQQEGLGQEWLDGNMRVFNGLGYDREVEITFENAPDKVMTEILVGVDLQMRVELAAELQQRREEVWRKGRHRPDLKVPL
ncbi:MAG: hypothetical protein A3G75_14510 [Verrucomicrobia bacterium RIFCSPLOWO2_12_FULL_64_8]|nr:MAG: hypothetical protein A3G75_14510 [Verrucomicrobia bacterium RIFCSPLOWO2_12_FULL_64_8]